MSSARLPLQIHRIEGLMPVAVAMAPGPVFLLFSRRNTAEVSVLVAVVLASPLVVVDDFVIIPDVVVAVVGVIDPVMVRASSGSYYRRGQRAR